MDIPSHGACVISSLVDADHIIEVRGFHCLIDIEQSDFLGGAGKFGTAGSACHCDEPRAFERSQGVTNADGVRPGAFGEQRAGRRSLFRDYRIENYAEALFDAPVDHVIDTLGETAKLLSGWSNRASLR